MSLFVQNAIAEVRGFRKGIRDICILIHEPKILYLFLQKMCQRPSMKYATVEVYMEEYRKTKRFVVEFSPVDDH